MRATPAFDVNHTARRLVSAVASFAVALTMVRFAFAQRPEDRVPVHDLEFVA
jgi:hypothetical protein